MPTAARSWVLLTLLALAAGALIVVLVADRQARRRAAPHEDPVVARLARDGNVEGLADLARGASAAVARQAVRALARTPAGLPHLHAALGNPRPEVRLAAALALRRAGTETSDGLLAEAVRKDQAPDVRAAAAGVLGHRKAWRHGDALIDAMEDADPLVRDRAAAAFREIAGAGLDPRLAGPDGAAEELRRLWPTMRDALQAYYAPRQAVGSPPE
jgi:hypothetical protein